MKTKTFRSPGMSASDRWGRDLADGQTRENWQSGEENQKRGMDWLMEIYRHNDAKTADRMAAHKDFRKWRLQLPLARRRFVLLTLKPRLAVHRDHLWSILVRPLHTGQGRHPTRRALGHHDPEPGARDWVASPRNEEDWGQL